MQKKDIQPEIVGKMKKVSFKKPLEQILQKFQVNQIISLKIFRDNKEIYLKIKIGERK